MSKKPARGGIDLGGTKIQAAVVSADDEVLGDARVPTPAQDGPEAVAEAMATALREAAQDAGVSPDDLTGIGAGVPGDADPEAGTVARAPNLKGWDEPVPLGPWLTERLGPEVFLGNDVQVSTTGEHQLGAGRGSDDLVGIFWGTGVGGGLILAGKPWLGRGGAAEVGHMVVHQGGHRCPCGRRGCMEAYAGRGAMEARARKRHDDGDKTKLFEVMEEKGKDRLSSGVWEKALEEDDHLARELFDDAIAAIATATASIINLLDIGLVVLGGGMGTRFGSDAADRISAAMVPHLFNDTRPPRVAVAELGDLGGAVGASLLAKEPALSP